MKTSLPVLFAISGSIAACSDNDGGRSSAQLTQVETTTQRGSSVTVRRSEIRYEGAHLREVANFENGAPAGTARYTYGPGGIAQVEYADAEGDRATERLTHEAGRLVRLRYEVPGIVVDESTVAYANGQPKEITTLSTPTSGTSSMRLERFDYDAEGRASKQVVIAGSATRTTELRYTTDGLLERATMFDGNTHDETYSYSFTPDGLLDEVTDTGTGRYEVTYDEGLISEVRWSASSGTVTTRYTYGPGSVEGWAFAPAVPVGSMFDLAGASYDTVSLLQGSIEIPDDIARASGGSGGGGSGGGGGGGGGGGATCSFTPADSCDVCLAASCCAETERCLTGTACYSYWSCVDSCSSQQCIDVCGETNPTGRNDYASLGSCAQAYCPASCGS